MNMMNRFNKRHGSYMELSPDRTRATYLTIEGYDDHDNREVLSERPLHPGERFSIKVTDSGCGVRIYDFT